MTNNEIATLLRHVAAAYSIKDEKKHYFQIVAYQKAADTIESATDQVKNLAKENKLEDLPGIGASMKEHLQELVKTGKVKHFDSVLKSIPEAVFPLLDIPTFGPKKAYRIVKEFHLISPKTVVAEIRELALKHEIAKLEGFGEKSEQVILQALDEHGMGKTKTNRMLLPFAQALAEKILAYLKNSRSVIEAYPLGSLRRKKETIGDLDFAVATDKPKEAIDYFTSYPHKERIIEKGPTSASIIISGGYQIDLMTQPVKSFGSLLQHFTGSKAHNIHLRDLALKKHLSLSEYGIKKLSNKQQKITTYETEESFYKALEMDWIPPEMREDTGEIERSLHHNVPKLVDISDIKGDLHIHSKYPIEPSHDLGHTDMREMLHRAKELRYDYLGFSEHNPSISQHTQEQAYSILKKRKETIEQIKESIKNIRVINLLETDILVNGDLAINEKCLSLLDATIVSIHSSLGMNVERMTERILKGLSHPKAKILAHPTGRMLNERPGYSLNWEKIFDFCKKNNKALEINSWPQRNDLPDAIVRQAVDSGVKMVIDTDSHDVGHMDLMRFGVWNARRGWATKHDILNTLEYNDFIKWLNS